jgi:hypothetical protein
METTPAYRQIFVPEEIQTTQIRNNPNGRQRRS